MRACLIIISLLVEALAFGQGFNERYDAFGWGFQQEGYGVELTPSGYTLISGSFDYDSIAPGLWFAHASVLLTHIDTDGTKIWEKRAWRPWHNTVTGWANCCDTIPGGGYVLGGASEDTTGYDEVYLMRFDAEGDTLWTRVFSGPTEDHYMIGRQVKHTPDGGFLIVGDTGFGNIFANGIDGFAIKTDSLGNEQWRRIHGGAPPSWESFISCAIGPSHTYYLGGSYFPTTTNGEIWVMRVDSVGEVIWEVVWGGPFTDGNGHLTTLSDGHVLVANAHGHNTAGNLFQPALTKLDSADGSIIWDRAYGPVGLNRVFFTAKETDAGDLIAAGVIYEGISPNIQKGLLTRVTSEGDSLWMFNYFYQDDVITTGQGRFYDVLPTADGGFIAAGAAYNPVGMGYPPGYSQDTWVVKVDGLGCIVPGCNSVGITEQATNLLDALRIWPNPVASGQAITVQLELPPSLHGLPLTATLVSADGKAVWQHALGTVVGQATLNLQPPQLSTGMYYVHVASEGKWLTGGKLVVQ